LGPERKSKVALSKIGAELPRFFLSPRKRTAVYLDFPHRGHVVAVGGINDPQPKQITPPVVEGAIGRGGITGAGPGTAPGAYRGIPAGPASDVY